MAENDRFRLRPARTLDAETAAAYVEQALLAIVHTPELDGPLATASMTGVAALANTLANHYRLLGVARRVFFRACGLACDEDGDARIPEALLHRILAVRADDADPDGPQDDPGFRLDFLGGESDAAPGE